MYGYRYYYPTAMDRPDEGSLVIYVGPLLSPSFSYWIVPGTAQEDTED